MMFTAKRENFPIRCVKLNKEPLEITIEGESRYYFPARVL